VFDDRVPILEALGSDTIGIGRPERRRAWFSSVLSDSAYTLAASLSRSRKAVALMATQEQARDALLDRIVELAPRASSTESLVTLAEAYAWVISPHQTHGSKTAITEK